MAVNDGKGIWDKYGMLSEISKKMEVLADAKGTVRCGLIWDVSCMIKSLTEGLQKEDEAQAARVDELKRVISEREKPGVKVDGTV